ncbi:Uncharacterized [Moorella glycerini]|uniref:Uncharacterized protein n=1 Tax=Neomoorella stamsii TaxID=1266720 RepID=A0A9X7J006_9FIRM|nr:MULTISPECIES: hypothetical protein [Moorella]PRR69575.1 hypothetical protein MOST_29970 [Moorella stamsii]CEP67901.1 Uncharacterized [Moorella glycerini]CEP68771.1 Uncharacterized [Moorella glycerini]
MNTEERVVALEVAVARLEERVENVEAYQARQNGSIQNIEAKFDKLYFWLIGICGGLALDLFLRLIGR